MLAGTPKHDIHALQMASAQGADEIPATGCTYDYLVYLATIVRKDCIPAENGNGLIIYKWSCDCVTYLGHRTGEAVFQLFSYTHIMVWPKTSLAYESSRSL
ncbi:unnamed protein product [Nezara viridula]|uniref:Uncharacterized protein n=1 Tax=Nezara viridula TaxID=85310 RepID=A0A9P0H590_NEZVI|nr:unnamed protein product [Nezara viridula]